MAQEIKVPDIGDFDSVEIIEVLVAEGDTVEFDSLFDGERPVVLVMGYYDCPLLCPWVFNSLQGTFNELAWRVGKEYRVVSVSIDPTNTIEQAFKQRRRVLSGHTGNP